MNIKSSRILDISESNEEISSLLESGKCLSCKELAIPKCYSPAGIKEYSISGFCEVCFDSICSEFD